jgi:hypothetical protein
VALYCWSGVVLPKHHVALGLPVASTQCYFGSYPARPKPDSAPAKAPPSAWTVAQRKHAKRHMALGMSALRRELKRHVSKHGFFHSNISFLKFINDDNNIYTLINFNENKNIYNTNNNIFSSNNMNYYKNNIIYNTKYNNIL